MGKFEYRYALGIAAKNFNVSRVQISDIEKECIKFDAMFENSNPKIHRMSILIVCATQYGPGLKSKFNGQKFFTLDNLSAWKHIHEVIVLDLTSQQNRAEFFGLGPGDTLIEAIENVILKRSS